ncbi:MAG: endonuclease domain-containing protein [Gulosibacter sp.]|uniref:endonuclease domain-containing protein n=1 Tax=Gulosibacter sp. TaxID=2817531 RepID=UPI003F9044E8
MHHNRGPATPTVLRRSNGRYVPVEAAVDPVELAFEVALVKLDASDLIVVGDSIVQRGLLTITEIDEIAASYPPRIRAAVRRINGFAESGTETLVRLWLEEMRIPFVQQFMFRDSQRADFLLGRGLILEVDSVAHHASREQQQKDYNRDQYLRGLGYVVFRVTYDDVMRNWKFASEQLMLIIQRGEHLKIPAFRRGAR